MAIGKGQGFGGAHAGDDVGHATARAFGLDSVQHARGKIGGDHLGTMRRSGISHVAAAGADVDQPGGAAFGQRLRHAREIGTLGVNGAGNIGGGAAAELGVGVAVVVGLGHGLSFPGGVWRAIYPVTRLAFILL